MKTYRCWRCGASNTIHIDSEKKDGKSRADKVSNFPLVLIGTVVMLIVVAYLMSGGA
jgi:hypothetical protein